MADSASPPSATLLDRLQQVRSSVRSARPPRTGRGHTPILSTATVGVDGRADQTLSSHAVRMDVLVFSLPSSETGAHAKRPGGLTSAKPIMWCVGKQAAAFGDVEKLTQLKRQLPDLANTPDANVSLSGLVPLGFGSMCNPPVASCPSLALQAVLPSMHSPTATGGCVQGFYPLQWAALNNRIPALVWLLEVRALVLLPRQAEIRPRY
jgi:hypothetical protein